MSSADIELRSGLTRCQQDLKTHIKEELRRVGSARCNCRITGDVTQGKFGYTASPGAFHIDCTNPSPLKCWPALTSFLEKNPVEFSTVFRRFQVAHIITMHNPAYTANTAHSFAVFADWWHYIHKQSPTISTIAGRIVVLRAFCEASTKHLRDIANNMDEGPPPLRRLAGPLVPRPQDGVPEAIQRTSLQAEARRTSAPGYL